MHNTEVVASELMVTPLAIGNGTRIAPAGSLLILTRGNLFKNVPVCIAGADVAFNQDVRALRLREGALPWFVLYHLLALEGSFPIGVTGIGVGKIDTDDLREFVVGLPFLAEQQKIADCLTSLDEAIAAQGRKVEALKAHKKGLMQHLFPQEGQTLPRLRFPEFCGGPEWEWKDLGHVAEIMNNRRVPLASDKRQPGPYPYYGASGVVDHVAEFIFDERLLLVGEDGAKWGAFERTAFIAEGKYWVNNHAHVLKCTGVVDTLAENYLTLADLGGYVTGNAPPKLTLAKLRSIALPVPPSRIEQQRIADGLASLDAAIAAASAALATLKTHKTGLMQGLFPSMEEIA